MTSRRRKKNEEDFVIIGSSLGVPPSCYVSENVNKVTYCCVSQQIGPKERKKMKNKLEILVHSLFVATIGLAYMCVL